MKIVAIMNASSWRVVSLGVLMALTGCMDNRVDTKCSDLYASRMDSHDFEHLEGGITLHNPSNLIFTRLNADC